MDNESRFDQTSATTDVAPTTTQPEDLLQPAKPALSRLWLIAGGVIVTGLIALTVVSKLLNAPKGPAVQVVEAPTPTPTPVRILSSIATGSAFISLGQTHASLSSALTAANLDDPSLSPPVLDLPLGFAK